MHIVRTEPQSPICCCYLNSTQSIQIVRISDSPNGYLERTVFPGQHIIFMALPTDRLEVHTGLMATAVLTDTVACDRLQIEAETVAA